jgi:rhamnosyltransferase
MRLGALVIVYHPTDTQLAQLAALRDACDALVVVDNTPVPDTRSREAATRECFTLIHQGNRGGVAGALNIGLTKLFDEFDVEAVALFDQDSIVPSGYFLTMRELCAKLEGKPFIAGPRIFDENDRRFLPELTTNGIIVRRLQLDGANSPVRCAFLISSGSLVSRDAYMTLGRFDEDLFIDHVDTEYCFRALARNVPLYVVPSLVLSHRIGAKSRRRIGPIEISTMNHPWTRRYYSARNAMQIAIKYGRRFPVALVPNLLTLWQIVQIVLGEDDKRAKLKGIFYGIADGIAGRLGSLDDAHPHWASQATAAREGRT